MSNFKVEWGLELWDTSNKDIKRDFFEGRHFWTTPKNIKILIFIFKSSLIFLIPKPDPSRQNITKKTFLWQINTQKITILNGRWGRYMLKVKLYMTAWHKIKSFSTSLIDKIYRKPFLCCCCHTEDKNIGKLHINLMSKFLIPFSFASLLSSFTACFTFNGLRNQ